MDWIGWIGLDWLDPTQKSSPARAPSGAKKVDTFISTWNTSLHKKNTPQSPYKFNDIG